MKRAVLVEGFFVLCLGILSMAEGIRLTVMDRIQMYDVLGPGRYNFGVGLLLMTAALSYLIVFRKERPKRKAEEIEGGEETENTQKMVGMFVVLGVYIASIHFFGYLPATLLFFLLIHRLVGFRSWWLNAGTTTFASIAFYYVFVHGLGMIFPKGVILEWLRGG